MKKYLVVLLLLPFTVSAQTDYSTLGLVKDRIDSIAKRKADSVFALLQAQIDAAIATIPTPASPKGLATLTSVSDKVDASALSQALANKLNISDTTGLAQALRNQIAGKLSIADSTVIANRVRAAIPKTTAELNNTANFVTANVLADRPDTSTFLPAVRNSIATKTSFKNVSDSVYKKAEMAAVLTDLRNTPVYPNKVVMLIGKLSMGDNLGGFYRWDVDSTGADEMVYLNKISSNLSSSGRWVRVFQRARSTTGGGVLVNNGGVKTLYVTGTTDANGEVVLNLTDNNLSTGNALFTEIWSIVVNPQTDASGPATAVQSYRKTLSGNLKTLTYGFYKANAITVVLAAVISPVANVGAGTVVQFAITGINSNG